MSRIFSALLVASLLLPTTLFAVRAQDAKDEPIPENLSNALQLDDQGKAESAKPLDLSMFQCPENASPKELLALIESLEEKAPKPTSQTEMMQLIEATAKFYNEVADKVLAHADATDEEKDEATQLKIVALSIQGQLNPEKATELDAFLNKLVTDAKDEPAKVKAYQMKLQTLLQGAQNDPTVLDKVSALADEILAIKDSEELQILGLEVKAQGLISRSQQDPKATDELTTFLNAYLADEKISQRLREKAQELKLVSLLIASQADETKKPEVDKLFDELLAGPASPEMKERLYKLRIQTLMPRQPGETNPEDQAKLDALVEKLIAEESEDLKSLGYAVKANGLAQAAQADPKKIDELFQFADKILAENPSATLKEQMVGLKIQGYLMKARQDKAANNELIAFVDKVLSENPTEEFKNRLLSVKFQLLSMKAEEDATAVPELEKMLGELSEVEELRPMLPRGWRVIYQAKMKDLAEKKAPVADLDALLAEIKGKVADMPLLAGIVPATRSDLETIAKNNNDADLVDRVMNDFIDFCSKSENEIVKQVSDSLKAEQALAKLIGQEIAFEGIVAGNEKDKKFSSSDLEGKVYLVDLWTTSEPAYFETIEELKELHGDFAPKGFEIVGINKDPDTKILTRAVEVFGMPWVVLSDKMAQDAGLKPLPEAFAAIPAGSKILVGADGKVILVTNDLAQLRAKLEEKLGAPEKKAEEKAPAAEPKK